MHVSYRWLGRHVDLSGISPQDVASDLTLSTAEVEGLEPFLPHLADVTVGHVVERESHPDADKLSLCRVDVGGETLQIVCGAPNVAAGQRVAVATVGTVLPGDLKIKKAKIRGVESRGMICSVRELGLGDEHDGIWVLPADATVGRPVAEALDMEDWVIEIDNKSVTHRPDLWGHRGFAREIAAMHGRELRPLAAELPPTGGGAPYPVRVESRACSRYLGLAIDGVVPGLAPAWMRHLLLAVGQRPFELSVDLSNFVMLDLGQPNHLFDRDRLSPEGIVVRGARGGETIVTLDDVERRLLPSDLLICSGDEPVALAGVMGGAGSKVGAESHRLLLEVACFEPTTIRRTAARLGLRTDASARFEKHLDPTLPLTAAAHLVALLAELQPAITLPVPLGDAGLWTDPARTIALRPERVRKLLGADVPDERIAGILSALGFGVQAQGRTLAVSVPSARATKDVTIEQDLVEEVGRLHRYGNVPERAQTVELVPPPFDARRALVRRLQDRLAGDARFHETLSYSFLEDGLARRLGIAEEPYVQVVNPVAEGVSRVRRAVAPSLLGALAHNRRQRERVALFELGKGYRPETADERGQPAEVHELAFVLAEPPVRAGARFDATPLRALQGVVEDALAFVERGTPRWRRPAEMPPAYLNPGRCMEAVLPHADGGEVVAGRLGELEPAVAHALGLAGELACDVAVAELSIDALLAAAHRARAYRPIPRFPGVKVDVALALPSTVDAGDAVAAIEAAGKGLVQSTELFDLYAGTSLGAGRKSLAWHVVLRSDARTLDDKDVAKFLERLERATADLGGELRRE